MKIKISVFFLIFLLVFGLSGITIHGNSKILLNDNDKTIYLKSGEYLFNDIEQKVVEHSEIVEFEYYINGISSINNMMLSYETSNDNVSIDLEQTSNSEFLVSLMSNATGETSIEVSCVLYLTNGEQIILKDEIFIYSREDYDFISKASMLDAKFYCYTYITNTDNPTFEEYDEFYSTNQNENIISTNISSNLSIEDKATVMSMDNINVSGKITWVDEDGRSHNASNVTVEIIDEDILGINNVLDTVTTNDLGQYNASVSNSSFLENGGNDIKLRVSTQGGNIEVVNNAGAVYKVTQKDPRMNITDTYLYLDFEIDPNDYTKDEDKERTYAFRVHQAMNLGAEYVETKKGDKLDTIRVKFPTTKSTSCYNGSKIFILEEDKNDWDVMLHEYGHYVSDYYNIDNNPGEDHDIGDCLNDRYGKSDGMNLAWGEGWPTYFSISAQLEMKAICLNITNVGDESYSDTDDTNFSYSLETPSWWDYRYGESNEVAISAVLLDLADGKNDENIDLGYTYIWEFICNNQCKDFSEFINDLYSDITDFRCIEIGEILSALDIASEITTPYNGSYSGVNIPTFSWVPNGGNSTYSNNLFSIVFFDKNKNFIYETQQLTNSSFTPTQTEWKTILDLASDYVYWSVKSFQTTEFTTGPYFSDSNILKLYKEEITLSNYSSNVIENCEINSNKTEYYKININYNKYYEILVNGTQNIDVKLYDDNLNEVVINDLYSENEIEYFVSLCSTGTYYLEVINDSSIVNSISLKIISRNTAYLSEGENDILINTYNNDDEYNFINHNGPGFYKFSIEATKADGSVVTYPYTSLKIYDHMNSSQEDKYNINGYSELAQSIDNNNYLYMYLERNGYYYIHVNMPDASYISVKLSIERVNVEEIEVASRFDEAFTETLINSNDMTEYATGFSIDQTSVFTIDVTTSQTYTGNITFILFRKAYNNDTKEYYIDEVVGDYIPLESDELRKILVEGTYYIGFFGNTSNVPVTIKINRIVTTSEITDQVLVMDIDENLPYGTEVRHNGGEYGGKTITEGFTRHIHFQNVTGVPSVSRYDYSFYSSNKNYATVSEFGTVFAKSVTGNKTVTITAVYKYDPAIIFTIELTIIDDTSNTEKVIETTQTISLSEFENGKYKLVLDENNSPYPWIQYYNWSVFVPCQADDIAVTIDNYGFLTTSGVGSATLTGTYSINPNVTLIIHINFVE